MFVDLLPVGPVEDLVPVEMTKFIQETLGLKVRSLNPVDLPQSAFDPGRGQYSSTELLCRAVELRPTDASKLLALTEVDIFIPMLTFVFGQAQLDGPVALLSLARLRQEFYGLAPARELFLSRVRKEVLHELGHTFGHTHCPNRKCAMSLSIQIGNIDDKACDFCRSCRVQFRKKIGMLGQQPRGNPRSTR